MHSSLQAVADIDKTFELDPNVQDPKSLPEEERYVYEEHAKLDEKVRNGFVSLIHSLMKRQSSGGFLS